MKVIVKKDVCIGCGACTNIAEDVFNFDEDGLAVADNSKITDENIEDVELAIDSCPVDAIEDKDNLEDAA